MKTFTKRIITLALGLAPFVLSAQTNTPAEPAPITGTADYDYPNNYPDKEEITLNYVRTITPLFPVNEAGLGGLRGMGSKTFEQTMYMDGYLRPLQVVIKKPINNLTKDLVKFYNYDASGRISDDLLPFAKTDRSVAAAGKFDKNVQSDQVVTYTDLGYVGENYRFSRNMYEQSLLGRPLEARGPGGAWAGSSLGVKTATRAGNSGDQVALFTVLGLGSGTTILYNRMSPASELIVTSTTDEDNLATRSYYNTEGQLLATENHNLRTYYVYDVYDRLRCVIPPKATEALQAASWTITSDIINGLCFVYEYDDKGRQISIKKPGIDPTYLRYDVHGRVIFSQDGLQRAAGKWVFSKYDAKGRIIQQGLFNTTTAGVTLSTEPETVPASHLNAFIQYMYNTPVYTGNDYVYSLGDAEFMIHYYFDDYAFITERLTSPNGSYTALQLAFSDAVGNATEGYNKLRAEHPQGLLTGIYTAVSDGSKWIAHVNYYNSDGLLIQTISDDLKGRLSVSASGYDFTGRLIKTVFQNNDATIQKQYVYDCYGRLSFIKHKIGNASGFRQIAAYDYDALGRMKARRLGQMNYTENYDYNIRGWITGINKNYARQDIEGFHFGQEIFYETGYEQNYRNGRMSGMQWRSKGSKTEQRSYGYLYDNTQRLTTADYTYLDVDKWIKEKKDFTTTISYDAGGNITAMKHLGVDAGHSKIVLDDMSYGYATNSNQLQAVSENSGSGSSDPGQHDGLGDFRDLAGETDYSYDASGNLASDANRNITEITNGWFNLNKPLQVTTATGGMVYYVYDAMGNQLRKRATWTDGGAQSKKTDYVGELVYEDEKLTLIGHDEGRIRLVRDEVSGLITYEYDYYLKDHLQNIRAIINEVVIQGLAHGTAFDPGGYNGSGSSSGNSVSYDVDPVGYIATSEPTNAAWETDLFDRVNETRGTRPASADPNDQYAAILDAASSRSIGPGKLIKVMSGDRIELGAEAFFHSGQLPGTPIPINTIATQVIAALTGAAAISGEINNVFSQAMINGELIGMALNDITSTAPDDTTAPSAYLNYLVFDEGFNILKEASGALQVQQANAWQQMQVPQFEIAENGYVYVFTSNQSQAMVNTDNLYIYHWKSVLLEEFHYYPFGLTFEVSSQLNLPGSNVRYNSQYTERNEFTSAGGNRRYGLEWYDFMARSYDAQIGRWMQPDPLMQHGSPYLAMSNNPTIFTDPLGLYDENGNDDPLLKKTGHTHYQYPWGGGFFNNWWRPGNNYTYRGQGGEGSSGPTDYGQKIPLVYSKEMQEKLSAQLSDEARRTSLEADLRKYQSVLEFGKAGTAFAGLTQFIQGSAVTISQSEKVKVITRAAAYDRAVLGKYSKFLNRAGRVITGTDMFLTGIQYATSRGTYSDKTKLAVNLSIGAMGLSKDPVNGTMSVVLGIAETAGAFDWLYSGAAQVEAQTSVPIPNAFGSLWAK